MKPLPKNTGDRRNRENRLYDAILALETPADVRAFFTDLCTPAELEAMADRWAVVDLLLEKVPYRAIAAKTGVSVVTIGRVARCLVGSEGGYRRALEKLGRVAS